MRLALLTLLTSLIVQIARGHIIDSEGNCIADCHEEEVEQLTGTNHAVVDTAL